MLRPTSKLSSLLRLLVLPTGSLLGCTPAHYAGGTVDWLVANHTPDTLLLAVRYPLDSLWASPAETARLRYEWARDSAAEGGRGHHIYPLHRMTQYQGQWYWVQDVGWANPVCDAPLRPQPWAQATPTTGVLTYKLPPKSTQQLTQFPCLPCDSVPPVPVVGLWLRQGAAQRSVLPAKKPGKVFRRVPTGQNQLYRYQLTVGPGLTLND